MKKKLLLIIVPVAIVISAVAAVWAFGQFFNPAPSTDDPNADAITQGGDTAPGDQNHSGEGGVFLPYLVYADLIGHIACRERD